MHGGANNGATSRRDATSERQEHEGALDAQRKLSEMGAPLPAQSSPTGQDPMQWALKVMAQAAEECKAKRLSGQLASHCGVGAMR
jgi:hypothetical protein